MSLISGAIGEKVQMPDGLQVDHLSENTVGHGVSVPGRTSGVAIETGYVGEYREAVGSSTALVSDGYTVAGSAGLTLQPGVYDLQATGGITTAATTTLTHIFCGINTTNTNDFTGSDHLRNVFSSFHGGITNAGGDSWRVSTPLYRVVVTTATTYWPKIRAQFGVSTCSGQASIFARRVG